LFTILLTFISTMNPQKTYKRLTAEKKEELIKRALQGEAVAAICKNEGISRTIFYRWLKAYNKPGKKNSKAGLGAKTPKGRSHWRRLNIAKEREVIGLWKNNPSYSIREIAEAAGVSSGGTWNVIKSYERQAASSGKKIKRYLRKKYKNINPQDKIKLIRRYHSGESIAKISREIGVSRTIFYKWLRAFEQARDVEQVLRKNNRRGESHWRFMPEVRATLVKLIAQDPTLSLSALVRSAQAQGTKISKSGVYYMLKSLELDTYQARLSYATSVNGVVASSPHPLESRGMKLAVPAVLILLISFGLAAFFGQRSNIGMPFIGINNTVTPTDSPSGFAEDESQEATHPQDIKQDLAWGAIAVNTPQDQYAVGEEAQIGFGVVDSLGNTICNADISFEVVNSQGNIVYEKNRVPGSGECSLQSVTNTPDYLLRIPGFEEEGEYSVRVKAQTYNGEKDFKTRILVESSQSFEVERRKYPTRIFPRVEYPVEVVFKAKEDFSGYITEVLPKGITASSISGSGLILRKEGTQDQILRWKVTMEQDQTIKLSYILHFPMMWPEFYEVGPLRFENEAGKLVYQEKRYWHIVADAL
jgi:transposase-like protein